MDNSPIDNVRLVALDIDGTLLAPGAHHRALPDERITSAVAELMEAGVVVLLATGRMFPGALHVAEHLKIDQPLICQQGASIHELDGSLLHRFSIDQAIAHEIVELAKNNGLPYAWFDAERYLVNTPNKASQYFADVSGVDVEHHPDPRASGLVATGVDVISSAEASSAIFKELDQRFGDQIELLDFVSVTAAHSKEANKGKALAIVTQELKIDPAQVVAIGDSVNDVSMLRWAGLGASPAHCDKHARQASDRVLQGDGVDGVASLLEELAAKRRAKRWAKK